MNREFEIIRPALPIDAEAICRVHVESIRVNCAADYAPEQIEAWAGPKRPQHYIDGMARGEFMLVAEADGQVVGFAALVGDEVRAVYVSPAFLRRGIGTALLMMLETEASRRDVTNLRLESTLTARAFYESQGYSCSGHKIHVMKGVDIPCLDMFKNLPTG